MTIRPLLVVMAVAALASSATAQPPCGNAQIGGEQQHVLQWCEQADVNGLCA